MGARAGFLCLLFPSPDQQTTSAPNKGANKPWDDGRLGRLCPLCTLYRRLWMPASSLHSMPRPESKELEGRVSLSLPASPQKLWRASLARSGEFPSHLLGYWEAVNRSGENACGSTPQGRAHRHATATAAPTQAMAKNQKQVMQVTGSWLTSPTVSVTVSPATG